MKRVKVRQHGEYYISINPAVGKEDIVVVIGRVVRGADKTHITSVKIVDIISISSLLGFKAQAVKIKQLQKKYNAKAVVCDRSGFGAGLVDELLQESFDSITGESLGCWNTVNSNNTPELADAPKILYELKPLLLRDKITTKFLYFVNSGKLRCKQIVEINNAFVPKIKALMYLLWCAEEFVKA